MIGMSATSGRQIDDSSPNFEHLRQSIRDILTTLVGTRICRRSYGSLVPNLIDQPCNDATKVRLFSAIATALIRFEPRVQVSSVRLISVTENGWQVELVGVCNVYQANQPFSQQLLLGSAV